MSYYSIHCSEQYGIYNAFTNNCPLWRGLLKGHSKVTLEALYPETSSLPIRYIVSSRMYLHNILQKSSYEMLRKIFEAQKQDTSPGNICELVSEDKESIGLNMSYQEIQTMNKEKFRNIVRNKTSSIQIPEEYKVYQL